jgi:hypothetical protein
MACGATCVVLRMGEDGVLIAQQQQQQQQGPDGGGCVSWHVSGAVGGRGVGPRGTRVPSCGRGCDKPAACLLV